VRLCVDQRTRSERMQMRKLALISALLLAFLAI
jgi:hypothetical protein